MVVVGVTKETVALDSHQGRGRGHGRSPCGS